MKEYIDKIFNDEIIINRIKTKLPEFFQMANAESSRAGKVGMEVGVLREKRIIALFLYDYGEENVNTNVSIIEPETDVIVMSNPISIKTKQGNITGGVKIAWTVDTESADMFLKSYFQKTDIILVNINWNKEGGFYFIPKEVQVETIRLMGIENYIKLPKPGTNNRGVEFSSNAINTLLNNKNTKCIMIKWIEKELNFSVYDRWVELWKE
jgi:hypothetical protein